jgi:hypothetical protein
MDLSPSPAPWSDSSGTDSSASDWSSAQNSNTGSSIDTSFGNSANSNDPTTEPTSLFPSESGTTIDIPPGLDLANAGADPITIVSDPDDPFHDPVKEYEKQLELEKLEKELREMEKAAAENEKRIREAFKPNHPPDCECPCPLTKADADSDLSWIEDPLWVPRWFHPGAASSYKRILPDSRKGNQCTYDNAGKLITHGPAAGTPDRVGGNSPGRPGRLSDHFNKDVGPLEEKLHGGAGTGNLKLLAIAHFISGQSKGTWEDYYRRLNAIEGWEAIMDYQNSYGKFYRPCVPEDAPENWGPWEFDYLYGGLKFTGEIPQSPIQLVGSRLLSRSLHDSE